MTYEESLDGHIKFSEQQIERSIARIAETTTNIANGTITVRNDYALVELLNEEVTIMRSALSRIALLKRLKIDVTDGRIQ